MSIELLKKWAEWLRPDVEHHESQEIADYLEQLAMVLEGAPTDEQGAMLKGENVALVDRNAQLKAENRALRNQNALLRSYVKEPEPRYTCFVQGCPGNHPSKLNVCKQTNPPIGTAILASDQQLTKREYFAAMAMQIYVASGNLPVEDIADMSVLLADSLIEALNK